MRIAYCLSYLWNSGGVDRVISVKANYLADVLGYDVAIITTDQHDRQPYFALSPRVQLIDLGVNYTDATNSLVAKFTKTMAKRHQHRKRLDAVLAELKPDITIAVTRRELPIVYKLRNGGIRLAERHMNKNCRFQEKTNPLSAHLRGAITRQEETWVSHDTRCITLTDEDKSCWRNQDNIAVIPNPITISASPLAHYEQKHVLAVGRISYEKGYDRLIEAWAKVTKQFPEWVLTIVGATDDLNEVAKVRRLIEALQLRTVQIMPPSPDIVRYYRESSLLVLSSRYEGLPLVLLEAMSCGLPCISFNCPCGPKDVISDGIDGRLVSNGDIDALAEAMIQLMSDKTKRERMGAAALVKSQQYSLPTIMTRWDSLFKELAK